MILQSDIANSGMIFVRETKFVPATIRPYSRILEVSEVDRVDSFAIENDDDFSI